MFLTVMMLLSFFFYLMTILCHTSSVSVHQNNLILLDRIKTAQVYEVIRKKQIKKQLLLCLLVCVNVAVFHSLQGLYAVSSQSWCPERTQTPGRIQSRKLRAEPSQEATGHRFVKQHKQNCGNLICAPQEVGLASQSLFVNFRDDSTNMVLFFKLCP